ncbi:MAG: hypothetical protein COW85_12085 [Ignavibacteria bacterium CG22_combo_CG10-13_8_21_14_all_37_15]|nr:MAG: hypothetical protein AUJ54_10740 [Ignavibacteria bacterium CG1_02_37_35]PIP76842.1 MAG: hypothetical protein COW85_12085 [Ignavibacteria bacterium CG22_combo_CG10-13_8_21_14_all_37_15]PIS45517.1 MAG: hypothetical protein COT22_04865 [Ignavibacteria bacterium CG08_land_8_20_14_0_20_37_9]PIX94709.1 MAG: hypothetical protein COZ25_04180 [Ignavibacteria bacterium CG_4_10_14_3_um_filter_37_18]PJC60231.1 MAG: hypothetical protein CO025_03725 [Ignavibacteria bacterium CG_4_9_14_0_2_um_filter_3
MGLMIIPPFQGFTFSFPFFIGLRPVSADYALSGLGTIINTKLSTSVNSYMWKNNYYEFIIT